MRRYKWPVPARLGRTARVLSARSGFLRRLTRQPIVFIVTGFVASRVAYRAAGVRFDTGPLATFWQFVDPDLLRHHLLQSIWYLHSQPPLFNLFVGMIMKLGGPHYATLLQACFFAAGLLLSVALYALMRQLGVRPWYGATVALIFAASPPTILFENWVYVEYLVATALVVAAVFLHRFAEWGRTRDATVAFSALGAVVLSRTLFHIVFLALAVGLVWLLQPARRRQVLIAATAPFVLCAGVYAKTFVMFGTPSSTTCAGMNVRRVTTGALSPERVRTLVREHKVAGYEPLEPFLLPELRPDLFAHVHRRRIPLLDRPRKSTGAPNFDQTAFLRICDRYVQDGVTVLKSDPGAFGRAVGVGLLIFARPTSEFAYFKANAASIDPVERAFSLFILGQVHRLSPAEQTADRLSPVRGVSFTRRFTDVAWFVVAAYIAAISFGLHVLVRARRARTMSAFVLTIAFVLLVVAYIAVVGNLLEVGENNRFRFAADPLVLALVAAAAASWMRGCGGVRRFAERR
jgi:hypothetical protein